MQRSLSVLLHQRKEHAPTKGESAVLVLDVDGRRLAVLVDEVLDTVEVVIKPLGKRVDAIGMYSGACILPDGTIALALNPERVIVKTGRYTAHDQVRNHKSTEKTDKQASILDVALIQQPDGGLQAIPMSRIVRLEQWPASRIEVIAGQPVVARNGSLIPLINIYDLLPERRSEERAPHPDYRQGDDLNVVVCMHKNQHLGLVIDTFLDVMQVSMENQMAASRDGVLCTLLIDDRAVEVLDLRRIIRMADVSFFTPIGQEKAHA